MPLGYHSPNNHNGDDTRGTAARKAQLADTKKDYEPAAEAGEAMRGAIGAGAAHAQVGRAQGALNRQLRYQSGAPMYSGTKFIGNKKP
jgi:hypothetical protein